MSVEQQFRVSIFESFHQEIACKIHEEISDAKIVNGFLILTDITKIQQHCYNVHNIAEFIIEEIGNADE